MSYQTALNNFENFVDSSSRVNLRKKAQAYGAVHLIFADVGAMHSSTIGHNRVSYAMSCLDKLANLRFKLGGSGASESSAFQGLLSESQKNQTQALFADHMVGVDSQLCDRFITVLKKAYDDLHNHIGKQSSSGSQDETERLTRLRDQRNMRHGTFLNRDSFDRLFFESDGTVPDSIATITFLLLLGLICDPEAFLKFDPTI